MSRKYEHDIVKEMGLVVKNALAIDAFKDIGQLVVMYQGDYMMIASDLVSGKACAPQMEPAYQRAVELIMYHGRCTFAGFLQLVEANNLHANGKDPSEALYFGEELLQWAARVELDGFSYDPTDSQREDVLDRGDILKYLDTDVFSMPIWHVQEIWDPKSITHYEGDIDVDLAALKDHQYWKDFRLAIYKRGRRYGVDDKVVVIARVLGSVEYRRICQILDVAIERGLIKW